MKRKSKKKLLSVAVLIISAIIYLSNQYLGSSDVAVPASSENNLEGPYRVVKVSDGDTITVDIDGTQEKLRLIGVDTPESVHPDKSKNVPYGKIASAYTKDQLLNQWVELEYDVQERDKYGRLLTYVYKDGKMFNLTLIELGHAKVSTYPPNVKYTDLFTEAQKVSRSQAKGLWQ